MHRFLLSCSLLLALSGTGYAQNIRVVDADGNLLAGIEVSNGTKIVTDAAGRASLPATKYPARVELTGVGFETTKQKIKNDEWTTIVLSRRTASLKETVVTGVPRPTRLQNALSQYRIITRSENLAQGNVNLADALATRLNMSVSPDASTGASNMKMQGMNGSKVKILIDGLPVNGREAGNIDLSQLNLNNIERIETIQGPMSVVYGSDAIGGVINLITRKTIKPWEASAGFNYETIGKYNADFNVSRRWNKHQLLLGGGRNYFQGWGEVDTTPNVPHRRLLWKPKEQYFGNATYNYTAKSGFRAQLASDYMHDKITNRGDATVTPYNAYATDEYYRTNRLNNRLLLEDKIGHWESRNSYALYYRTRENVTKNLVSLTEQTGAPANQDTSRYDDITLRSNYSNILNKLKYDAGYDISLQRGVSGKIPGGSRHINDYALYQNLSYALLNDRLTLQGSLRESYNTSYSAPLIYSFQALYTPVEKVQVRASYGTGFRAPTLKEQYLDFIDQNHKIYGNPDLKPERSKHVQASVSYQAYQKNTDFVQLIFTGFYNDVYDQIALANLNPLDPTNQEYRYSNFTRMRNTIANVQLEQQWSNLNLVLEYGLTHVYEEAGNYPSFNSSELTARANYYWKAGKIAFNAFYKFTGASKYISYGVDNIATYAGTTAGYHRLDASLSRKFWNKKLMVIAGVKNILDVRQVTATGMPTATTGQAHGGDGSTYFLPRSLFTTVRLDLN